jgi:RNA polymerase sigma factor (sigma-70 family)
MAQVSRRVQRHVEVDGMEEIYRQEWAPLVRLALILTGEREKAEDIVHDAFVRLAARPLPREPHPYLRQMVINATRDHHRRHLVERRFVPERPTQTSTPEVDETLIALRRLPMRQRQALVLRYYADLSVEDVSRTLRCPIGTAKSLIHRGIETLRKEMTP